MPRRKVSTGHFHFPVTTGAVRLPSLQGTHTHTLMGRKKWRLSGFVLGTGIAVIDLLITDTSGDTGLPPLLGWLAVAGAQAAAGWSS